jgi:hypothetical protein
MTRLDIIGFEAVQPSHDFLDVFDFRLPERESARGRPRAIRPAGRETRCFSLYVTGWMISYRETAGLARQLIENSCEKQRITPVSSRFTPIAVRQ